MAGRCGPDERVDLTTAIRCTRSTARTSFEEGQGQSRAGEAGGPGTAERRLRARRRIGISSRRGR
jgi:hypothetical protein